MTTVLSAAKNDMFTDISFQTKPELGWEMIREVVDDQQLRAHWVTCDEAFGRDTAFLDHVAGSGLWYFAEVPHDTRVWLERPLTAVPVVGSGSQAQSRAPLRRATRGGGGRKHGRACAPRSVAALLDERGEQRDRWWPTFRQCVW